MRKTIRSCASFGLLLFIVTAAASAQSPAALTKGNKSIAFTLPDGGGGTIGIWKFTSDRRNVGLNFGFDYTSADNSLSPAVHRWNVAVGPAVKSYFKPSAHVAPYHRLGLTAGYAKAGDDVHSVTVGAQAGLGVDWFPVDQISIGGFTGLQADVDWHHDISGNTTVFRAATFLSGLTMHIYF